MKNLVFVLFLILTSNVLMLTLKNKSTSLNSKSHLKDDFIQLESEFNKFRECHRNQIEEIKEDLENKQEELSKNHREAEELLSEVHRESEEKSLSICDVEKDLKEEENLTEQHIDDEIDHFNQAEKHVINVIEDFHEDEENKLEENINNFINTHEVDENVVEHLYEKIENLKEEHKIELNEVKQEESEFSSKNSKFGFDEKSLIQSLSK